MKINFLIKKRIVKTRRRIIKQFLFFNYVLYQYTKIRVNKKYKKQFIKKEVKKPASNQRVFYLKVHRLHKTAFDCIQHWVNIAYELNAFIYFVCDNPQMEKEIYQKIYFGNFNFEFIKSDRTTLKKYIQIILNKVDRRKMWQRIGYAMTTAFAHAYKNKYKLFYNIDADDILLFLDAKTAAKAFIQAEEYAKKNKLDLFNLDMFVSKSFGTHWSFGVVMCLSSENCINAIEKNVNWRNNKRFIKKYKTFYLEKYNYNIDWFFTYLRDTEKLCMKTFYIENALVAHMPDYILEHGWAFMFQWKNNYINFPILNFYNNDFYNEKRKNNPIFKDCVKIDIDLNDDNYKKIFRQFYYWSLLGQVEFQMDMLNYGFQRNSISNLFYQEHRHDLDEFHKLQGV